MRSLTHGAVSCRHHRSVRPSLDVILTLRDVIAFLLVVTPPSMTNAYQLEAILTSQTSQDIQDRHHHYIYDKSFVPLTLHDYLTITKDSSLKTPQKNSLTSFNFIYFKSRIESRNYESLHSDQKFDNIVHPFERPILLTTLPTRSRRYVACR